MVIGKENLVTNHFARKSGSERAGLIYTVIINGRHA